MIAIPAIDLRDGACVQLVGGSYDAERVRLSDPVGVAKQWLEMGFKRLHVVDLDAATGRGSNLAIVNRILNECDVPTQVGGGIREEAALEHILSAGARWAVVGTRALEDWAWLERNAEKHKGRLIVAADVQGRTVVTHGWQRALEMDVLALVEALNAVNLGGVLVTAVHREGALQGTDLALMAEVAKLSKAPVLASGGVTTLEDLDSLAGVGVEGAIIGMALYTGRLDPRLLSKHFASG